METIQSFAKYFWEKLYASIPLCFFTFTVNENKVIWGIIFIVIIDTILGVSVAFKYKTLSSYRLGRAFWKIAKYGLTMASVWILSAIEPDLFGWAFRWVGIFIILTELFSNFEKLSLLGFKLPTKLMAKLNNDFEKYFYGEKEPEDILDKRG